MREGGRPAGTAVLGEPRERGHALENVVGPDSGDVIDRPSGFGHAIDARPARG